MPRIFSFSSCFCPTLNSFDALCIYKNTSPITPKPLLQRNKAGLIQLEYSRMTATIRMFRSSRPLGLDFPSSSISSNITTTSSSSSSSMACLSKGKLSFSSELEKRNFDAKKTKKVVVKVISTESVLTREAHHTKTSVDGGVLNLSSLAADAAKVALGIWKPLVKRRSWKRQAEMLIEKTVVGCRFFTLLAVGGTLLGSILCFVEGSLLIMDSYFEYFQAMSKKSPDEGHVVQLLIEGIDMFMVGSAMLILGVGLYVLFMGARNLKRENGGLFGSKFFGLFQLKTVPSWVEMRCVSQAKSKIGHALLMILQVGVVDKFKNVPLVTPLDLACFAGAVFVSSACIFLLSRLYLAQNEA